MYGERTIYTHDQLYSIPPSKFIVRSVGVGVCVWSLEEMRMFLFLALS